MQVLAWRLRRVVSALRAHLLLVAVIVLHELADLAQLVLDELYLILLGRCADQIDLLLLALSWHEELRRLHNGSLR